MQKIDFVKVLGYCALFFYLFDFSNKVFILHSPIHLLWYSSLGLLVTTIALFKKNIFLLTSMFCALSLIESLWLISFFSKLLFQQDIIEFAAYAFAPDIPRFDFLTTLYHLLLVPSPIIAFFSLKSVHRFGWIGASLFALMVVGLSQFFSQGMANINCIQTPCLGYLHIFYTWPTGIRISLGLFLLTFFEFLPLNFLLNKLAKLFHWEVIGFDNWRIVPKLFNLPE